jgi:xylitol oxidase
VKRELNWAGNVHYEASSIHYAHSLEEVREIVNSHPHVRALGSRHSFSALANTRGVLVSLRDVPHRVQINPEDRTATVSAGMTYGEVARDLNRDGWALHNMASLPHITVAGACATATHGSGTQNQCLSASIRAMEVVSPGGALIFLTPDSDDERFTATQAGLGGMGIVTSLTLEIEPSYLIAQQVYLELPFDQFFREGDDILASAYSVSLFSDFRHATFNQAWRKARTTNEEPIEWPEWWFGARRCEVDVHPVPGASAAAATPQRGEPGPWHERLSHFRLSHVPSHGQELQSEYLIDRTHAAAALRSLLEISEDISSVLLVSEVRAVARDAIWMSPAYERDAVAFHFTWRPEPELVAPVLSKIEQRLRDFDARPHWGKIHRFSSAQLVRAYPRLESFQAERRRFDPSGVFSNQFLDDLEADAT